MLRNNSLRWLADRTTKNIILFLDFISTFPGHVEMKSPLKWGSLYFNVSWKCSNIMGVIQEKTRLS